MRDSKEPLWKPPWRHLPLLPFTLWPSPSPCLEMLPGLPEASASTPLQGESAADPLSPELQISMAQAWQSSADRRYALARRMEAKWSWVTEVIRRIHKNYASQKLHGTDIDPNVLKECLRHHQPKATKAIGGQMFKCMGRFDIL